MMGNSYRSYAFEKRRIGNGMVFMWLPKRCYLTSKWLWLTTAYKETALWVNPETFFEHRYYHKKEYIFAKIKGIV